MPVGKKLRELRLDRKLTQEEVAAGINCSHSTYSRYETGRRQPPMEVLSKLADFFGVSMDYLYGKAPLNEAALSDDERDIIYKWRNSSDEVREYAADFLAISMNKKEAGGK